MVPKNDWGVNAANSTIKWQLAIINMIRSYKINKDLESGIHILPKRSMLERVESPIQNLVDLKFGFQKQASGV